MKLKKLLTVGMVCAAVFGCLLIAGCTAQSSSSDLGLIVGQWGVQIQRNGKTVDAVLDVAEDGTSHFMVLGSTPGIQLTEASIDRIEKTGENTYAVKTSKEEHVYTYDEKNDTFTDEKGQVFTRLDPHVGIWSGIAPKEQGGGNMTIIVKPDGTGLTNVSFDDGTSIAIKMTWTKNAEGTYTVTMSGGNNATVTVDAKGKTATTSDGYTLTKQLWSEWYLLATTGIWYNADTKTSAFFNGDGTGFINQNSKVINFKWELKDASTIETTLINDTVPDGTKSAQWTYNSESNTLTSADGTVYSRPDGSVEGQFTLY